MPDHMTQTSYRKIHFPSSTVQQAVCIHVGFSRSLCDVEELPAERIIDVSWKTIRRWWADSDLRWLSDCESLVVRDNRNGIPTKCTSTSVGAGYTGSARSNGR